MDRHLFVDGDPRIICTIGGMRTARMYCSAFLSWYSSLAFDHRTGSLFASVSNRGDVMVISFGAKREYTSSCFGSAKSSADQIQRPHNIAFDYEHDRVFISDRERLWVYSLLDQSFVSFIGDDASRGFELKDPQGIAIDKHHHRIIIVDTNNDRLVFLSSIDLSFLFSVGAAGYQPGEFCYPSSVAIDHDRRRIIVSDTCNHRVQVLSSIDGSFLFEFGQRGQLPGEFDNPLGVCIDNQGRIIVADQGNNRLQAFTHEGHHISSFDCLKESPNDVAFDEHRGLIAFAVMNRVHVIGANQWLADTKIVWRPDRHRYAPSWMKQAVMTMTMIRSLVDESSAMAMIPNELLFEIFSYL